MILNFQNLACKKDVTKIRLILPIQRKLYDKISLIDHQPLKGGIISEGIFNLVPSSKSQTKSLSLHFQPISKKLRDSDLVWFFQVPLRMEPNLRYIASKIIPPIISLQFF